MKKEKRSGRVECASLYPFPAGAPGPLAEACCSDSENPPSRLESTAWRSGGGGLGDGVVVCMPLPGTILGPWSTPLHVSLCD